MTSSVDIVEGVKLSLRHASDYFSLWEHDHSSGRNTLICASEPLQQHMQRSACDSVLSASVSDCVRQYGLKDYLQSQDKLGKGCGELYIQSLQLINGGRQLLVKHERVPYPFELHHRSRSKSVSMMERRITRNIVHELLTPINSIQGISEQLSDANRDDNLPELLEHHHQASHSIKSHLAEIVNFISLSNNELRHYNKQTFDILETLFSVSSKSNRSIFKLKKSLGFSLNYPTEHDSLPVFGYPDLLEQLLLHLIDNAIKFTPDGGSIIVSVSLPTPHRLHMSIADTGCGIAADDRALLFRPFVMGNLKETHTVKGLGLGLAAALECLIILTDDVDIQFQLESELGLGSTFSFSIPLEKPHTKVTEKNNNLQLPLSPEHYRVLVAEDNPTQQMIIRKLIEHLGFRAQLVSNGLEAVGEYIRGDTHYDLILMDIQMPGISGHDATKLIRKHEQQLNIERTPIIAITANIEQEVHNESIACGMDGHYGKPVSRIVLDQLIRQSLLGVTGR